MTDDIFAVIDAATGCQQCGGPLGASPSSDFCADRCQTRWHADRAELLIGYREPWDRPCDFPGVGTDVHDSAGRPSSDLVSQRELPPWRLPRSTGNLVVDWRAAEVALSTASTDAQRAAVKLRMEMLAERFAIAWKPMCETVNVAFAQLTRQFEQVANALSETFRHLFPASPAAHRPASSRRPGPNPSVVAALEYVRTRNTGPPVRQRPPRRIDARGVYR